jgi:hypothetical protein
MLQWGNAVLLKIRFFDMAEFTTLIHVLDFQFENIFSPYFFIELSQNFLWHLGKWLDASSSSS